MKKSNETPLLAGKLYGTLFPVQLNILCFMHLAPVKEVHIWCGNHIDFGALNATYCECVTKTECNLMPFLQGDNCR